MKYFNTISVTLTSLLCCCVYIFPEVVSNPFVANLIKKNGVATIKTNNHGHEVFQSKYKSNHNSKSEFEENLEPLPDDPSEDNSDSGAADTSDKTSPAVSKSLSFQTLLKEQWSSENSSIYKDMTIVRSYTFSMKFDKLQLNFIGSRYSGCTVKIACSSSILPMNKDDFIQVTDGLGGQITYSEDKKFWGSWKPSQNGTDIYVRYQGKNPSIRCTASCMRGTERLVQTLTNDASIVSPIDTTCKCGVEGKRTLEPKIVGGEEVTPFEIPWQIAVVLPGERIHYCGASLINERYALSAAHCFPGIEFELLLHAHVLNQVLQPGTNESVYTPYNESRKKTDADEQSIRVQVEEIIIHPLFSPALNYDVALLRFKEKIDFSHRTDIRPICLESWKAQTDYSGQMAIASGWGKLKETDRVKPNLLQKVAMKMHSIDFCNNAYEQGWKQYFNISASTAPGLCGGYLDEGKGPCKGDSGGPISLKSNNKWRQIGIVSFGQECAKGNLPGVYSNVGELRQWIQRMVHHDTKWCQE